MKSLTFRELQTWLNTLSSNDLDCTATVYVNGEFMPVKDLIKTGDFADILDPNHPVIVVN